MNIDFLLAYFLFDFLKKGYILREIDTEED